MKDEELQPEDNRLATPTADLKSEVQLTPPDASPAEVEENVTKANVLDVQRYLRWADKLLKNAKTGDEAA